VKKVIAAIAIAGSTLALAACGSSTPSEEETESAVKQAAAEEVWDDLEPSQRNIFCEGYEMFGPEELEDMVSRSFDDPEDLANMMRIIRREC